MAEGKGIGSKLFGLFVEGDAPVDAELPTPAAAAPEVKPARAPIDTTGVTPANVDFDGVFRAAGVDPGELDQVKKAQALLQTLPPGTTPEVQRTIVEASLKAFGFDIGNIVLASQNQLKAIDTFVRVNQQQFEKASSDGQVQVTQLEERIEKLKQELEKRSQQLREVVAAAETRRADVMRILGFFSSGAPASDSKEGTP